MTFQYSQQCYFGLSRCFFPLDQLYNLNIVKIQVLIKTYFVRLDQYFLLLLHVYKHHKNHCQWYPYHHLNKPIVLFSDINLYQDIKRGPLHESFQCKTKLIERFIKKGLPFDHVHNDHKVSNIDENHKSIEQILIII